MIVDGEAATGTDVLNHPQDSPVILVCVLIGVGLDPCRIHSSLLGMQSVTGCSPGGLNATAQCPTEGGRLITIVGDNFKVPATVTINGEACTGAIVTNSHTIKWFAARLRSLLADQLTLCCSSLPEGAGLEQAVVVASGNLFSPPAKLLSYAAPVVSQITGCTPSGSPLSVVDCARLGGQRITISGSGFGKSGAIVYVGQGASVLHGVGLSLLA